MQPHYSVPEIAKQWRASDDTIREIFRDEPGVVRIGSSKKKTVLRIPADVLERVHQRLQLKGQSRRSEVKS
jgi:hypothetical protein